MAADGTNGTVDLRGEFIRGLDAGRGVDSSRAVGSFQDGTEFGRWVYQAAYLQYNNADSVTNGSSISRDGDAGYTSTQQWLKVRPRNVALLACMRN